MKILILSIVDPWKSAHNRLFQLLNILKRNHDLTILSINDWWKAPQTDLKSKKVDFHQLFEGIETKYVTSRRISPIIQETTSFVSFFNQNWLKHIKSDIELIINYNTLSMGFYYTFFKCPMIFDIADDLVGMVRDSPQLSYPLNVLGAAAAKFFMIQNIKKSSLVSVSANTLRHTYHLPSEKTLFIPNGVDTKTFKYDPSSEKLREKLGLSDNFILGYVGVLREWVDFSPVFRVLKRINDIDLRKPRIKIVIVGKEGDELSIKGLAMSLGVSKDVIFLGEIPYQQVPKYISMFNIGLIPFKYNSITINALPLKLFEYAACGKPIISTPIPEVVRIMQDKIHYARTSDDYYRILYDQFEEINDLHNNKIELRNHIIKKYDWEQISKNYEKTIMKRVSGF